MLRLRKCGMLNSVRLGFRQFDTSQRENKSENNLGYNVFNYNCKTSSVLMIDVRGPSPLWVVPQRTSISGS